MPSGQTLLCAGAIHWDLLGISELALPHGTDGPGRISRRPGGVAFNIAAELARAGHSPTLIGALGSTSDSDALFQECERLGIDTGSLLRVDGMDADRYLAIEAPNGLIAAIADTRCLEAAAADIVARLLDHVRRAETGSTRTTIVLDGNLPGHALHRLSEARSLGLTDLRLVPASPAKAARLAPLLKTCNPTLYANHSEAEALVGPGHDAAQLARRLRQEGAACVVLTNGPGDVVMLDDHGLLKVRPTRTAPARVTGAGDVLAGAHIAATLAHRPRDEALEAALEAARSHLSCEVS